MFNDPFSPATTNKTSKKPKRKPKTSEKPDHVETFKVEARLKKALLDNNILERTVESFRKKAKKFEEKAEASENQVNHLESVVSALTEELSQLKAKAAGPDPWNGFKQELLAPVEQSQGEVLTESVNNDKPLKQEITVLKQQLLSSNRKLQYILREKKTQEDALTKK